MRVVAHAVIKYEYYREWDERGQYVCRPEVIEKSVFVSPEYVDKKVVDEGMWKKWDEAGIGYVKNYGMARIVTEDGWILDVSVMRWWVTRSSAVYEGGRMVPACRTGVGGLEVEIVKKRKGRARNVMNIETDNVEVYETINGLLWRIIYDYLPDDVVTELAKMGL